MKQKWVAMSYEALLWHRSAFYDVEMGLYEIGLSFYELKRVMGSGIWVTPSALWMCLGLLGGASSVGCADSGWGLDLAWRSWVGGGGRFKCAAEGGTGRHASCVYLEQRGI